MKLLMVTWHGGGNVPPLMSIGSQLVGRGHQVKCLAPERLRSSCERHGLQFRATRRGADFDPQVHLAVEESQRLQGEVFLGPGYGADLVASVADESPDVLLIDCFLVSALTEAERLEWPRAVLAHVLPNWFVPFWDRVLLQPTNAVRQRAGLEPVSSLDQVWAHSDRVIVTSPSWLDGEMSLSRAVPNIRYTGPVAAPLAGLEDTSEGVNGGSGVIEHPPERWPLVLVSFSTTAMGQEEPLRNVILALSRLEVTAIVTAGPAVDINTLAGFPNVDVRSWASHAEVLPHAALAITHGGLGTVLSALAFGVPLLCLPLGRDQDHVAGRVEELGVGLRIDADAKPDVVAAAITELLGDPAFTQASRDAARRLRTAGDGAANAADELEAISRDGEIPPSK